VISRPALALAAVLLAATGAYAQETPDPASWRAVPADRLMVLDTTKGRILIETAPEFAPNHVARFTDFIRTGFYEGTIFHRVIDDFMVQGGDPEGTGAGGSGTNIDAEFTIMRDASLPVVEVSARGQDRGGFWHGMPVLTQPIAQAMVRADGKVRSSLTHCAGVMSTARNGAPDPAEDRALWNTGDSQFFMMRYGARADGTPNTFLDQQYTAWGRVVSGLDVVRAINIGTVGETRGFEPDSIVSTAMANDLPEDARPQVWVLREDGPEFQTLLASVTVDGVAPDVCEIEIPSIVQDPGA
jgi:peptidylprolyl isomerase